MKYILIDHGNYNKVYHIEDDEDLKYWIKEYVIGDFSVFEMKNKIDVSKIIYK